MHRLHGRLFADREVWGAGCVDTMTVCRYGGCWHWCVHNIDTSHQHFLWPGPPSPTVQGVTRVSELRIQCIVVGHRAKYTVSTHGDNGSDCNTSLMMSYPWHHLLALGTSHSLNESPNSRAEQCVDCWCHCNNSRLGWAQSLNRVDWYLQPLYLCVACFCQSEQSVVSAWLCSVAWQWVQWCVPHLLAVSSAPSKSWTSS